ncbi:MAG: hypothetical protein HY704_15925 [Gemmatimonadetes bacterium]|nr:hypothetical protein [Gemmatimonadota bacterium]
MTELIIRADESLERLGVRSRAHEHDLIALDPTDQQSISTATYSQQSS